MSETDQEKLRSIIVYGIFLQKILLAANFAVEYKKSDYVKALEMLTEDFIKSLTTEESQEFQRRFDEMVREKTDMMIADLKNTVSADELKKVTQDLVTSLTALTKKA